MISFDREGAIAKVRYTNFTPDEKRPDPIGLRTKKSQTKRVIAPSGHSYVFRQRKGTNSNWLRIDSEEADVGDLTYFERAEEYEVERISP